ncbi:NUDIX domain-containing protein [Micromonospora sp. NPDC004704]
MTTLPGDYTATLPRKRMGSAVLLRDREDRILLVEPTYKDYWEFPGGLVEDDEPPYRAAVREVAEELGLSVAPGRLLVVDWVPPELGRTDGVMFVFDGGLLDPVREAEINLPADELRSWAWSTPEEAEQRLPPLLARRATAALLALTQGTTLYLEDGNPVT